MDKRFPGGVWRDWNAIRRRQGPGGRPFSSRRPTTVSFPPLLQFVQTRDSPLTTVETFEDEESDVLSPQDGDRTSAREELCVVLDLVGPKVLFDARRGQALTGPGPPPPSD